MIHEAEIISSFLTTIYWIVILIRSLRCLSLNWFEIKIRKFKKPEQISENWEKFIAFKLDSFDQEENYQPWWSVNSEIHKLLDFDPIENQRIIWRIFIFKYYYILHFFLNHWLDNVERNYEKYTVVDFPIGLSPVIIG